MAKFIIRDDFWELFPEAEIAIILAKGIDNTEETAKPVRPELTEMLEKSNEAAKKFIIKDPISENQAVAVWREAFRKFKTKKGARCSIEALLKRVQKGKAVGAINPLVDIYNTVSLTYGLPCGGEDLDTFCGDLLLTKAEGGEAFLALGDEENDDALPGEIIYKDAEGAVCRCWNWRDGQRTMLTEGTKNAFLIIESVDPERGEDLRAAAENLADLTVKFLGGSAEIQYLNLGNKEVEL
ncbi:MAG: B3/4 domain-containing protein [Firmicutes bacterium]|nr:B3/4 domain-containing protein [Bacillota bacterium]NBI61728.1 hypothetical protein [Clostridiales bacterium]